MLDQQKHWRGIENHASDVDQVDFQLPVTSAPEYVTSSPIAPYALHVCAKGDVCITT